MDTLMIILGAVTLFHPISIDDELEYPSGPSSSNIILIQIHDALRETAKAGRDGMRGIYENGTGHACTLFVPPPHLQVRSHPVPSPDFQAPSSPVSRFPADLTLSIPCNPWKSSGSLGTYEIFSSVFKNHQHTTIKQREVCT
jgi:hypothetical protein